jgi:hypothetical protein
MFLDLTASWNQALLLELEDSQQRRSPFKPRPFYCPHTPANETFSPQDWKQDICRAVDEPGSTVARVEDMERCYLSMHMNHE